MEPIGDRLTGLESKKALTWVGRVLTVGVVAYLIYRLGQLGWRDLLSEIPTSPWFYLLFVLIYASQPLAELVIYRRLWPIPGMAGIRALIKKRVFNEEMAGYSGEVFFFWWLHRRMALSWNEAFRTVRDINILSSVAALSTAAVLLGVLGTSGILQLENLFANVDRAQVFIGIGVIISLGVVVAWFRRYIFSLPAKTSAGILGIHYGRLIVVNGLTLLQWAVGVPEIGVTTWLTYLCILIVLNRIPFLPSKDLFFLSLGIGVSDSLGHATTAIAGMLLASSALYRITNLTLYLAVNTGEGDWMKDARVAVAEAREVSPQSPVEPSDDGVAPLTTERSPAESL